MIIGIERHLTREEGEGEKKEKGDRDEEVGVEGGGQKRRRRIRGGKKKESRPRQQSGMAQAPPLFLLLFLISWE